MLDAICPHTLNARGIADAIETAATDGRLAPGTPLPSIRHLAHHFRVNPTTIATSYRLLRERDVIETGDRRGSRIRPTPSLAHRDGLPTTPPPGCLDLASGNPDPALLPPLAPALHAVAARTPGGERHLLYGTDPLSRDLTDLARAAFAADHVPDAPVTVTSGALEAIDHLLRAHLRRGDAIAVEDPGFPSVYELAAGLGLKTLPLTLDENGVRPESLAAALAAGARAVTLTVRAHNPTGAAVTAERADHLRHTLAAHRDETVLIEDDHCFGIVDADCHTLAGATRHWAMIRSVAKTLGPDLRMAVLTGDETSIRKVTALQRRGPGWVSRLLQEITVELWQAATTSAPATRATYRARREALLAACAARGIPAKGSSGLNVWIDVPAETHAVTELIARGWATAPGAPFRIRTPPAIRVTTAALPTTAAPALADALADLLNAPTPARRGA